nr:integrase, catalytic region, zinc finger, CCHC-type, peptidase aspartic, catalytic [Tanacetum cinerariifolium]
VDKPKLSDVTPQSNKLHASMPSHSVPQPREFNVMKHRNVIAPGMFKINPSQIPRVDLVPNKQSNASIRTNPITNSQRHVTFKENVVQIYLWPVDSGCSKHMTGNIKLLINFVWKFLGTVRFGNDHIAAILRYGTDLEKITKKWPKSDKIEHEIVKNVQKLDSKTFFYVQVKSQKSSQKSIENYKDLFCQFSKDMKDIRVFGS